jgi:hypothetical protein
MRTLALTLCFGGCLALVSIAGCGDDSSGKDMSAQHDLAVSMHGDMASCNADAGAPAPSACGHPCDTGNSKGVGKFCKTSDDCKGNAQATICSSIMNSGSADDTYFCTIGNICDPTAANTCGEDAHCQCHDIGGSNLCGCVPDRCGLPQG